MLLFLYNENPAVPVVPKSLGFAQLLPQRKTPCVQIYCVNQGAVGVRIEHGEILC